MQMPINEVLANNNSKVHFGFSQMDSKKITSMCGTDAGDRFLSDNFNIMVVKFITKIKSPI